MNRKIIVFGISPFSRMVCALMTSSGATVVARTAHKRYIPAEEKQDGPPFVAFETLEETFRPNDFEVFVALEHARWNAARAEIARAATLKGFRLASYVHPSAQLGEDVILGEHSLVLEGVIAQYGVRFGANAIIGAKCYFGQQAQVGSHTYFGSGVFVDRFAKIDSHCVLCSQVRVGESVAVPSWTQLKALEDVRTSLSNPTLVHEALRAPGFIIDRRTAQPSP